MFSGKGHSKLAQTAMMTSFLKDLQAIAPEYLNWNEVQGKLICVQKPVNPKLDPAHVNTVPEVLLLLKLTSIKPDDIIQDKQGNKIYIFTLQDFHDKLNAKKWSRTHAEDFAGINSKAKTHKPKK